MRYQAVYARHLFALGSGPANLGPGILDTTTGKFHARPEYSDTDVADTCRWLNSRCAKSQGAPHQWKTDGMHSNQFCGKCFTSR